MTLGYKVQKLGGLGFPVFTAMQCTKNENFNFGDNYYTRTYLHISLRSSKEKEYKTFMNSFFISYQVVKKCFFMKSFRNFPEF